MCCKNPVVSIGSTSSLALQRRTPRQRHHRGTLKRVAIPAFESYPGAMGMSMHPFTSDETADSGSHKPYYRIRNGKSLMILKKRPVDRDCQAGLSMREDITGHARRPQPPLCSAGSRGPSTPAVQPARPGSRRTSRTGRCDTQAARGTTPASRHTSGPASGRHEEIFVEADRLRIGAVPADAGVNGVLLESIVVMLPRLALPVKRRATEVSNDAFLWRRAGAAVFGEDRRQTTDDRGRTSIVNSQSSIVNRQSANPKSKIV